MTDNPGDLVFLELSLTNPHAVPFEIQNEFKLILGQTPGETQIFYGGKRLTSVKEITIHTKAGEPSTQVFMVLNANRFQGEIE